METSALAPEEICRRSGLRVSRRRLIVLKVLNGSKDDLTMDEIYRRAVRLDDSIAFTTIYRTVRDLVSAGLVIVLDILDSKRRYRRASDSHGGH